MTTINTDTWPRRSIWIGLSIGVLLVAFLSTYADMVQIWWTSSTFNHCLLVVPISGYLIWIKRDEIALHAPGVSRLALLFVLLNSMLWLVGEFLSVAFFQHLAVVGMVIGIVWALIGTPVFLLLLFPLCYLYFGVPEGEVLVPYLQDWTATVLVTLLRLTDIPVFLEGRHLSIPSGDFVVAEACSGINYLIATLAVGTMFAYLRFRSPLRRAAFMLLAVLVPLAANGFRAYGIVMIAHLSDHKYAMGVDHIIYGWLFFGVVILLLFALGNLFSDIDEPSSEPKTRRSESRAGNVAATACTGIVLALSGPAVLALTDASRPIPGDIGLSDVPSWEGPATVSTVLDGVYKAASQRLAATYDDGKGESVVVEIAYYRTQSQGAELINQVNAVFAKRKQWMQIDYGVRELPSGAAAHKVRELLLRDGAGDLLVWYWYDIEGHPTINDAAGKLLEAKARFASHRYGSAGIAIATRAVPDRAAALGRLTRFMDAADLSLPHMHKVP
jgi:exosortase A